MDSGSSNEGVGLDVILRKQGHFLLLLPNQSIFMCHISRLEIFKTHWGHSLLQKCNGEKQLHTYT